MHFLCLHGIGANSHVFETQTASIRHEMDHHHTFHFVEGNISCPPAPEIKPFFSSTDEYFQYYDNSTESIVQAVNQLSIYIEEEGPFDGVIAFSQGAALVSTYLFQASKQEVKPFRCAIFLSGARPFDTDALSHGRIEFVEPQGRESSIDLPTAHIWGVKDIKWKSHSQILATLFDEVQREEFNHGQGHEIPGARAHDDLQGCVKAIRRTIERASLAF